MKLRELSEHSTAHKIESIEFSGKVGRVETTRFENKTHTQREHEKKTQTYELFFLNTNKR